MKRRIFLLVIAGLAILFIGACAKTRLADYQFKTPEEEEVVYFLMHCDEAFQEKEMSVYGDCFHENALIQVRGSDERELILISKKRFTQLYLEKNLGPVSGQNIVDPAISVRENTARMHYIEAEGGFSHSISVSFEMVKEDDRWYITSYRWR